MISDSKRKVLILTGPGGSGKTTIARLLKKRYGFVHLDADREDTEFFPKGGQWLAKNSNKLRLAHDKILNKTKEIFDSGQSVVVDYIIFGRYLDFFGKFKKEFGRHLEIKILFPSLDETIMRDKKRKCWTTGRKRIMAVRKEFENIKGKLGAKHYIDTSGQTPETTARKILHS